MEHKRTGVAAILLLLIPVFVAISGLLVQFNLLDFAYLSLALVIFARYYFISKKQN